MGWLAEMSRYSHMGFFHIDDKNKFQGDTLSCS